MLPELDATQPFYSQLQLRHQKRIDYIREQSQKAMISFDPVDINGYSTSSERAARTLSALNRMQAIAGYTKETTAGYKYLVDVLNSLQRLGSNTAGGKMSRANQLQFFKEVKNNRENANTISDLGSLADDIAYESGITHTNVNGQTVFGTKNKRLYGV